MKKAGIRMGRIIGADTAGRADSIVNGTSKSYIKWSQEQVGAGTGGWAFMGRYLVRLPNICEGLTTENSNGTFSNTGELQKIYDNGTPVVLVDNRGTNPGYEWGLNGANGISHAQKAKAAAIALGIPAGKCIFVDVERKWSEMGNYLNNYKNELENVGTTKYKMGVYFSASYYNDILKNFSSLGSTFTWVAKWNKNYMYPNWPTAFDNTITGLGQLKIWQFIDDIYEAYTNYGKHFVDLNLIMDDLLSSLRAIMHHPYL